MAFINFHPWITALFFAITWCHVAGEKCPVYGYSSGFYYLSGYKSCTNGCCGRYPNYYCCTFSTAALAGIVLGCILAVCGMIFLCLYCVKKKKQPGRVVRPVHPTTNTIVFTGTSGSYPGMGYPNQPYGGVPQPPPYKRLASPPPEYGAPLRVNPYQGNNSYNGAGGGGGGYGYGQAWNNNAAQPSTADAPPPAYAASAAYPMSSAPSAAPAYTASAAPSTASAAPRVAAVPPASTSAAAAPLSRYDGYGQNHGWSDSADMPLSSATAARAPASTSGGNSSGATEIGNDQYNEYGRGNGWSDSTASSSTAPTAASRAGTRMGTAASTANNRNSAAQFSGLPSLRDEP